MAWRVYLLIVLATALVVWPTVAYWYTDWLWFVELGYPRVFWVPALSKAGLFAFVAAVVWAILYLNLRVALRALPPPARVELRLDGTRYVPRPGLRRWLGPGCAAVAVLAGLASTGQWVAFQQFLHAAPAGEQDPVFGLDVSFYLFRLPFWRFLQHLLWGWLLVAGAGALAVYLLAATSRLSLRGLLRLPPGARAHLSLVAGLLLLVRAGGFRLDAYELLTSQRGLVFGITYADAHARLPALQLLAALAAVCAALLFLNVWLRTLRFAAGVLAVMVAAWFVGVGVVPPLVQQLVVAPAELSREAPYLRAHVESTLRAYGLHRVRLVPFQPQDRLDPAAVQRQRATLDNVRLWDYRPLLETFRQLQSLRAYYTFSDVDIDRYPVGGRQQQLMLAVRELDTSRLPPQARTWVNQHLVYTHGYGVVASPVHRISEEGLPELWLRDIPPRAEFPELRLDRPEIYFGELTRNYVIVHTRVEEFDYPRGDENVTTRYQGRAGIPLRGWLRRMAFATRFGDWRVLLSTDLTSESRVLFARAVPERVRRLAPFLSYDRDPYAVVADGRVFWVVDAYTTSDRYPYSQPTGPFNYIRNSVKAVVDAYHGDVRFYVADPADPVLRVYARIFPGLFRPLDELPASLRAHLRYPLDLFEVQAQVYATYHMRDPRVFYNREDVWAVANEIFADRPQPVEPYYVTLRLPDAPAGTVEFVLILPMTPQRRDNMVAWLAARNDPPNLGELQVFTFPKDRVVFGPMQVESRINQDPYISQQLTLWNQQGSRVIRGNLLVVPVEQSLLYVEPIFLQAERSQLPELRRVVVAQGPRVAMAATLDEALSQVLEGRAPPPTAPGASSPRPDLAAEALRRYRLAQELLRRGDLAGFQRELEALGRVLEELARRR
ncbi:MAG: UPF0182 family protein [Armatimonadota bacterium]|nr:UPF0182 family protein [Armatimonadota bacterium]MDR5690166.1 UPF0182 family protein [Armatimonadota bacterium]